MNGYPNVLSMALKIVYQPQSSGLLTIFQANHQNQFKWIISHHKVDNRPLSKRYINGYPNGLSITIKYFISHHLSGLLTIFQANHQHLFKWIVSQHQVDKRPLSKWFKNGYPNGLSMSIQIVYQPQSKWIIN